VPVVKACIDNKSKALFASTNGSCPKGRSAIDIGATGANVKSIAQLVSASVVSIKVSTTLGSGSGSGSIYKSTSSLSYVITNNHVIESAATSGKIEVELNNGDIYPASIVGRNSEYDLAVISIKKGNLPEIPIGDSSSIAIGDAVVAFGSPLGLSGTVTSGIVSALNRPVTTGASNAESFMDAIQTDAAINPGNSGGPLLNQNGEVIGVNTAIIQGAQGLGFAIPIETAQRIAKQIIEKGTVSRAYLGIQMVTVDANVKKQVNQDTEFGIKISEDKGVLITRVVDDSPAAKAGAKRGDVITKFNDKEILTADQVTQLVEDRDVGDKINMEVKRNGQTIALSVETAQFPQKFPN
jgi:putative serine protease PepD